MAEIKKVDEDRRLAFGWFSVAVEKNGDPVIDSQGDVIAPTDLENAAYAFVLEFRDANTMHSGPVTGQLVESFMSTPDKLTKMGLAPDALPTGWWGGFRVDDEAAWQGVKSGKYKSFSIEGTGKRVPI